MVGAKVDAWRNKMAESSPNTASDVATVPPSLETRTGKKTWLARRARQGDD